MGKGLLMQMHMGELGIYFIKEEKCGVGKRQKNSSTFIKEYRYWSIHFEKKLHYSLNNCVPLSTWLTLTKRQKDLLYCVLLPLLEVVMNKYVGFYVSFLDFWSFYTHIYSFHGIYWKSEVLTWVVEDWLVLD